MQFNLHMLFKKEQDLGNWLSLCCTWLLLCCCCCFANALEYSFCFCCVLCTHYINRDLCLEIHWEYWIVIGLLQLSLNPVKVRSPLVLDHNVENDICWCCHFFLLLFIPFLLLYAFQILNVGRRSRMQIRGPSMALSPGLWVGARCNKAHTHGRWAPPPPGQL